MYREEAANFLGLSPRALDRFREAGELNVTYVPSKGPHGKRPVYDLEELRRLKKKLEGGRTPRGRRSRQRLSEQPGAVAAKPDSAAETDAVEQSASKRDALLPAPSIQPSYKVQICLDADIFEQFRAKSPQAAEAEINNACALIYSVEKLLVSMRGCSMMSGLFRQ